MGEHARGQAAPGQAIPGSMPSPPIARPGLAVPGPPAEATRGPIYGARYGDSDYDSRWGGPVGAPARPGAVGAQRHGGSPGPRATAPGAPRLLSFRPGVLTLRPQSLGDLLDGAVRTIRLRPGLFLGVGAMLVVAATVVRAAIDVSFGLTIVDADGVASLRVTPSAFLTPVLAFLVAGVLAPATADAVLGRELTSTRLRAALGRRAGALAGFAALILLVCAVPTLLVWFALGGRNSQTTDMLMAMGFLAVVGELLLLPFIVAPAVLVLEGVGPLRALRRSAALVRGSAWRTVGVALLGRLLVLLVRAALTLPALIAVQLLGATSGFSLTDSPLGPALSALFVMLTTCLTLPFEAVLRDLFYVDLRVRAEGLDMALVGEARREASIP